MSNWSVRSLFKQATWKDVEEKAQRYREEGKIHLTRNSPKVIVSTVDGDHGSYDVELNRQDPTNPLALSSWSCTCPWGAKWAWQRTRQFKKYEGRTCAHALGTLWESFGSPMEEDGNEQTVPQAPDGGSPSEAMPGGNLGEKIHDVGEGVQGLIDPNQPITPGTMPAGPPIPGASNPPLPAAAQIAPNQAQPQTPPAAQTPGGQAPAGPQAAPIGPPPISGPTKPGQDPYGIPGALSSWKMANWWDDPEREPYQHGLCDTYALAMLEMYPHLRLGSLSEENVPQHWFAHDDKNAYDSIGRHPLPYTGFGENEGYFDQQLDENPVDNFTYEENGTLVGDNGSLADYERAKELIPKHHPDLASSGWKQSASWKLSVFQNGDNVRANADMQGEDREGNIVPIPRNSIGEVLDSDETTTWAIFPLHQTGNLEPHLVKVQDFTASFSLARGMSPFVRRRRSTEI